jgi:predicted porin
MGQVRLGRQEQSIHSVHTTSLAGMANNITGSIYSAGTADVSTNAATIRQHGVFLNRAVTYISPRISGFTFEAQTARQETQISGTNQNTEASENGASVKYSAGKLHRCIRSKATVASSSSSYDFNSFCNCIHFFKVISA